METAHNDELSGLRAKILNNSIAILRLFSERMDLSSRIAVIKASSGLDLRLRDRELDVIRNSGINDEVLRSILVTLFEFSIRTQETAISAVNAHRGSEVTFRGKTDDLLSLLGTVMAAPGVEFVTQMDLPESLKTAIQMKGGHIVTGKPPESIPEISIGHECPRDIASMPEDGLLRFSTFPPDPASLNMIAVVKH
ncbi:MAG: chorismate mutase [Candidatus Thermoplasmatota archaeon]|jgi:chorismate mutase|nr:chorismate mutase [Candidatus Thermoplasmatota archaeon]